MTITADQRQRRKQGVGGSDAAAIMLGADDYQTILDVYCSKVYDAPDTNDDVATIGNLLEPVIRQIAALKLGVAVTEAPDTYVHPKHEWMIAHLDGEVADGGIIECKAVDWRKAKALGEPGSDFCLPGHYFQVQHQLEVTGRPWCHVAYFVSAFDVRMYLVPRDEEIGAAIVAKESAFWHDNVLARVPPESDDAEARMRYLAMEHAGNTKAAPLVVSAGTSAYEAVEDLRAATRARRAAQKAEATAKARIQSLLGDATRLECPTGTISWSVAKSKGRRFSARFRDDVDTDADVE